MLPKEKKMEKSVLIIMIRQR